MINAKWRCDSCDLLFLEQELLSAANPFAPSQTIHGCPNCFNVDGFVEICDEPKCGENADCGFPTSNGYRRTCGKHYRFATGIHETLPRREVMP